MDENVLRWRDLVLASVRNGDDLRNEAQLLLDAGRPPRALALAVLSFEEYGKAIHALVVINAGGSDKERGEFERAYRSHHPKIVAGALWSAVVDPTMSLDDSLRDRLTKAARTAVRRKMDGFYVDRQTDGTVVRPWESVGRENAQEHIQIATDLGSYVHQVLDLLDSPEKYGLMWEYGPEVSRVIDEVATANDASSEDRVRALRALLPEYGIGPKSE